MNENQNNVETTETVTPVETPVTPVEPAATPVAPVPPVTNKKSNPLPIIIVIALIVLIGGGCALYFLVFGKVSSKQVMEGTINKVFKKAETISEELEEFLVLNYKQDVIDTKVTAKLSAEGKISGQSFDFKDIDLTLGAKFNLKDREVSASASTSQGGKEIINLDGYIKKDNGYAKTNILDKTIKFDMSDYDIWDEIIDLFDMLPEYNTGDFKTIATKTKEFMKDSIKDDYLSQENGTFKVGGQDVSGLKNTLTINSKNASEMLVSIFNSMLNDDEYLSIVAKYTGMEVSELKDEINDAIEDLNSEDTDIEELAKINIYTNKKGKFLAFDVVDEDSNVIIDAVSDGKVTTVKLYEDEKEIYSFTYDEKDKVFNFKVEEYEIKVQLIKDGTKISVSGEGIDVSLTVTDKVENQTAKSNIELSGDINMSGEKLKASVSLSTEIKKADSVDKIDSAKAVGIEELTQDDLLNALSKLSSNAKGTYLESVLGASQNYLD